MKDISILFENDIFIPYNGKIINCKINAVIHPDKTLIIDSIKL
jgi:hypothetical protein